jgi:hypothetical protein
VRQVLGGAAITILTASSMGCMMTRELRPTTTETREVYVRIESEPEGAEVYSLHPESLQETFKGRTPVNIHLATATMNTYPGLRESGLAINLCTLVVAQSDTRFDKQVYQWGRSRAEGFTQATFMFRIRSPGHEDELLSVKTPLSGTALAVPGTRRVRLRQNAR